MAAPKKTKRRLDPPDVINYWKKDASSLAFGREEFRLRLVRTKRRLPAVMIDDLVESFNWARDGGKRTGELTFRRPLTKYGSTLMASGDEVRCEVSVWGRNAWKPLWRMKVSTPTHQIASGAMSVALESKLDSLRRSRVAWKFREDKSHPSGWTATQITRNVAERFSIPLGRIAKAKHRIKKLVEKSAAPYDIVVKAWREERLHTGRRFDVDASRGILEILELREPRYMLLLGATIIDAAVQRTMKNVASAVIVTATTRSKKKKRKLRVRVVDKKRQREIGYVVRTIQAPKGADSKAELRAYGKSRLARSFKPKRTVTFTHPGIPWVDRGDAIRLYIPEDNLHQIVFVTSVRHTVTAGAYDMDVGVRFSDPWLADRRKGRAEKKKAEAERRRKRSRRESDAPEPKKATTRGDSG